MQGLSPRRLSIFAALLLGLQLAPGGRAETHILLTLEWPPYTGVREPDGGIVTALVNDAFKAAGDDIRVGYFSWRRVLQLPRTDRRFAGSYPMYYSLERTANCHFSDPIGESPVGLAERRDSPVAWKEIKDLKGYRIGVVKGYVNSPRFDELVNNGDIPTLPAETDEQNLKNLMAGKVQAVVIDHNAFRYMSLAVSNLQGMDQTLQLNPQLLVVHKLYLCFPKDAAGEALRDRFNKGLRSLKRPLPGHLGSSSISVPGLTLQSLFSPE